MGSPRNDHSGKLRRRIEELEARLESERKTRSLAEQKLDKSRDRYRLLYDSIRDAILVADTGRSIIDCNPAFIDLFGYSLEEIRTKKTVEVYADEDEYRRMGERIRENIGNPNFVQVVHYKTKSGRIFPGETNVFYLKDEFGDTQGFIGLIRDITQREKAQQQMLLARKIESVAQLAAGLAHELNTPLQYLATNLDFVSQSVAELTPCLEELAKLQSKKDIEPRLKECALAARKADTEYLQEELPNAIEQCRGGVKRMDSIISAMQCFAHTANRDLAEVDVAEAIRTTLTVTASQWREHSEVATRFEPGLPAVRCVPAELSQILLQLVTNAAQANAETFRQTGTKTELAVSAKSVDHGVRITVADDGPGIAPENRHRIFDPFFTTRDVGEGSGQGLSVVYSLVTSYGGEVAFDTGPQGTTFIVWLPCEPPSSSEG